MTQARIDWRRLSYHPGDTLRARVVVLDRAWRSPRSIQWTVYHNAAAVSTGSGEDIAVNSVVHGVYKAHVTLVDFDGIQLEVRSAVTVSGGAEARATLPPAPFAGSMVRLGSIYGIEVGGPAGVPQGAPALVASQTQTVYLLPGTTHISFALDPEQADTDGDVVVRTRAGNWALFGGQRLGTEDLGFGYRVDPDEPVPAPADLKLTLTTEVYHVAGASHASFSVRVMVLCWRKGPQLYRYEACPHRVHPGGTAGATGVSAARLAAFFERIETVFPDGSEVVYTIPASFSIPGIRMDSSGLPALPDRSTGLGFTESNRGVIYESEGMHDLDAFAVAGIPGIRPGIVSVEKGGYWPEIPRIVRVGGRLLLYCCGAPLQAGTRVNVGLETGNGIQTVTMTVPSLVEMSTEPDTFVLAAALAVNLADYQFAQTGLVATFSVDASSAVPPVPSGMMDPRPGADYIYSSAQAATVNFAGVCYSNPQPRRLVDDIEALAAPLLDVPGCQHSSCGPVGLYCYSNKDVQPTVTVAATDASASEGGDTGTFTFTRTGANDVPLTVFFTMGGSATSGTDYQPLGTFVSFAVGSSTATKTLVALADALAEPVESAVLSIAPNPAYLLGSPSAATVTIIDKTPVVTVIASGTAATESGVASEFSFVRTGAVTGALSVNFTVAGSAIPGVDYQDNLGTSVTFAAGQAVAVKTVTALPDNLVEGTELIALTLVPGSTYALGNPKIAYVYITDTTPVVTVTASGTATESGTAATFIFARTGATTGALLVNFAVGGSATPGTDYAVLPTPLLFGPGQVSVTRTVTPLQDLVVEGIETVTVTVQPGAGYAVGNPSSAFVDIIDDDLPVVDPVVTVTATDSLATEWGDTGTFTFHRTGPVTNALTVLYTVGGTATAGADYEDLGTSVTFAAGQANAVRIVNPFPDDQPGEGLESVALALAAGAGYTVGSPSLATVNIQDVLPTVSVSASDPSASAVSLDPGAFTFSRNGPTGFALTVLFTVSGSAAPGTDYTALPVSVTFGIGQSTVSLAVTPLAGALIDNGSETVIATLSPSGDYTVSADAGTATVTIAGDLVTVVVFTSGTVDEASPSTAGGFTIRRKIDDMTTATDGNLLVQFRLEGTAQVTIDYTIALPDMDGIYSVTIPDLADAVAVNLTPIQDNVADSNETVVLTLVKNPAYQTGDPDSATQYIVDNDVLPSVILTATLDGGLAVDGLRDDGNLDENSEDYILTSWRAALPNPPDYPNGEPEQVWPYIDGSDGDSDPFTNPDPVYKDILKDVFNRVSGQISGAMSVDVNGFPVDVTAGGKDMAYAAAHPTHDGYTAPTWVYIGGRAGGWPHTGWPFWGHGATTVTSGWYAMVSTFNKQANTGIIPGRWDYDNRRVLADAEVPNVAGMTKVQVRVRGVAQRSVVVGGEPVKNGDVEVGFCLRNGQPANARDDFVKLTFSGTPDSAYYLNCGTSRSVGNVPYDYIFELAGVRGGELATLEINNQDGFQYRAGTTGQAVPLPGFPDSTNVWIRLDIVALV